MTADRTPAAAWDAEYSAGRYRDKPPVAFTRDILAAARRAGVARGLYIGRRWRPALPTATPGGNRPYPWRPHARCRRSTHLTSRREQQIANQVGYRSGR